MVVGLDGRRSRVGIALGAVAPCKIDHNAGIPLTGKEHVLRGVAPGAIIPAGQCKALLGCFVDHRSVELHLGIYRFQGHLHSCDVGRHLTDGDILQAEHFSDHRQILVALFTLLQRHIDCGHQQVAHRFAFSHLYHTLSSGISLVGQREFREVVTPHGIERIGAGSQILSCHTAFRSRQHAHTRACCTEDIDPTLRHRFRRRISCTCRQHQLAIALHRFNRLFTHYLFFTSRKAQDAEYGSQYSQQARCLFHILN